jgi:hypothetical protein
MGVFTPGMPGDNGYISFKSGIGKGTTEAKVAQNPSKRRVNRLGDAGSGLKAPRRLATHLRHCIGNLYAKGWNLMNNRINPNKHYHYAILSKPLTGGFQGY